MVARRGSSKALNGEPRVVASAGSRDKSSPEGKPGQTAMERRLYTVVEAGAFLGVSVWTIYRWIGQRRVPFVKIGRAVRFDKLDLEKLIEECKVQPGRFGLADDGPY